MTALFHALIHLARLRWLGAAFCALAMLCVSTHASALAGATAHARIDVNASADNTTTASASDAAQTKDRVWGFDQNSPLHVWSLRSASTETHLGISPTLSETASASSYAARGAGQATEGIYEFTGQSGKSYVGQSSNIPRRLGQHARSGKLPEGAEVTTKEILGGKTAREVAEQQRINELGGIKNLENKVNPIGPNRQHLMEKPQ